MDIMFMGHRLTEREISVLKLIDRSQPDARGWVNVSYACEPLVFEMDKRLVTLRLAKNCFQAKLSSNGRTLVEAVKQAEDISKHYVHVWR